MKKLNTQDWYQGFITVISHSFILLFLYAASSKLLEYDKFTVNIGQSPMLTAYAGVLAWLVPAVEVVLSVMLVFTGLRLYGLFASFSLMVMFTTYIFTVLHFMEDMPCACGGVLEKLSWDAHLVFNIGFVVLAGIGAVLEQIPPKSG
ncbi:putative membrane protein YphA (DoxX/SURF4 family) [Pedobacter africanus]|uniref:Membrane protein YphA (DoxX/SURF4 family) n=1 Tax=Pedobacter africanus TaxID=151894 RepID=A0ACC6L186_9SPHI|nr:MauE/DoxX family redox-associated membrane protein [Pedobacter africanus]MDR6785246.1 putative membrane protein YphA (DoxX/SURF4 family) [Pedobacter africanus]